MTQTKLAPTSWHREVVPNKKPEPKPKSRLDAKFEEWAKREGINLKQMKLMEKKNGVR